VAIASGFDRDRDALPIRTRARVLNAKLKVGESIEHVLGESRLAYLVPSTGTVEVNGVRIHTRDGAAIKDVDIAAIRAIEDADAVMVDLGQLNEGGRAINIPGGALTIQNLIRLD
jgi:quercetin 2,3-dioxygenase